MASGALPKRVTCPTCGAPEGMPCRDPATFKNVKPHVTRAAEALAWYERTSPDGLTPKRRDEMVMALRARYPGKGQVGQLMQKITTSPDPEQVYAGLTG